PISRIHPRVRQHALRNVGTYVTKLWLSKESLTHNLLVVGSDGTMKTSLLLGLSDQAIAAGHPCVFIDVKARKDKASYVSHYYRPGRDNLFNVADKRCV